MELHGLILAAGRGSRMGDLTEDNPKCLTPLAGQSLLSWQIGALKAAGVAEVAAIGGYRKEVLEDHISLAAVNTRWSETNMVRSLMCADHILSTRSTLISYSDIVYHPDAVRVLAECTAPVALTYDAQWLNLWSLRFKAPLDDAETFKELNGWLQEIGGKTDTVDDIQGQYMGLLKFTPEGWGEIKSVLTDLDEESIDKLDMTGLIHLCLAAGRSIGTVQVQGRWCEVDSWEDLTAYQKRLASVEKTGTKWSHDWRWET